MQFFADLQQESSARAVARTLRRAFVGYVILFGGILAMYHNGQNTSNAEREAIVESGQVVSVAGCNRDFHTIETLRGILMSGKRIQEKQAAEGEITPEALERANAYYDTQLARLVLPDCREAEKILTDDPDAEIAVPKPLYPKP